MGLQKGAPIASVSWVETEAVLLTSALQKAPPPQKKQPKRLAKNSHILIKVKYKSKPSVIFFIAWEAYRWVKTILAYLNFIKSNIEPRSHPDLTKKNEWIPLTIFLYFRPTNSFLEFSHTDSRKRAETVNDWHVHLSFSCQCICLLTGCLKLSTIWVLLSHSGCPEFQLNEGPPTTKWPHILYLQHDS